MDLLLPAQQRASGPKPPEPPRLEIKKDPRGLVTVQGEGGAWCYGWWGVLAHKTQDT
jgi:hypothetical protein